MFRFRTIFSALLILSSLMLLPANAAEPLSTEEPIEVVTSFSILENLVEELGGNHVAVTNLVGRNMDAHIYRPKPSDAVAVAEADLVVMNGFGFEGWITRLMDNNDYENRLLVATRNATPLLHGEEIDPHAWQSFTNIRVYIDNISEALIQLKPAQSADFRQRQQALKKKVAWLEADLTRQVNLIPRGQRVVVTSHDAFAYLGREFDIQFFAPVGFNGDSEPSATDVAAVIDQIRSLGVRALFVENISSPRLLEQISAETGVAIGGSLYSDALSELDGPAATYLDMMRHNLESLVQALNSN